MMATRYTDLDPSSNGTRDFVPRKHLPTVAQMLIIFVSSLLIAVSLAVTSSNKTSMIFLLFALFMALGWYFILQTQRNRDLVLATDFQNALFASALGFNNKFCIIIRRDGNIVYIDRSFQDIFPDFLKQTQRTVDALLDIGRVARADRNKIFSAIERGVYEKVIFEIRAASNDFIKIVMSVEPILRPSGFILLRGREYVETRAASDQMQPVTSLNKSNITLFSYVMDSMNMGVYMTDPAGNIIYVNPILEQWLAFKEGEITSNNLSLQDIIHHSGLHPENIEPDNYEGEIMLQKKTGGLMKSFINQKIIRDDQGKVLGCTAVVHSFVDQKSDEKKKLW